MARSLNGPSPHVPGRTISEWMAATTESEKKAIIEDIAGTFDLGLRNVGDLIRDLQPYLADDATLITAGQGMEVLALIICRIQVPPPRPDLHLLVQYLCHRLENKDQVLNSRAGIKATAASLLALARMSGKFIRSDAPPVLKAVFAITQNGVLKDQKAPTRLAFLQLVDFILREPDYSQTTFGVIGYTKIVQGLVAMAEFEKDPSCLRILFKLYATIGEQWQLVSGEYDMIWESFIRYYPITLKESATRDPATPGPKELKSQLLECFTSNNNYAKNAFPRLLELMDTSTDLSASNKKDVLDTLEHCVKHYLFSAVEDWALKIWDSLKFEVWNGENEEFIQGSLNVIQQMLASITHVSLKSAASISPDTSAVLSIVQECGKRVQDSGGRFYETTGRILHAVASSSVFAFSTVVKQFLPTVFVIDQEKKSTADHKGLLQLLNWILKARLDVKTPGVSGPQSKSRIELDRLGAFQSSFLSIFRSALFSKEVLEDASYRIAAIEGLGHLVRISKFLSKPEKQTLSEELAKVAADAHLVDSVHDAAISALRNISIHNPNIFRFVILPNILATLPQLVSQEPVQCETDLKCVSFGLETIVQIACVETCKRKPEKDASLGDRYLAKYRNFEELQSQLLFKIGVGSKEKYVRDAGLLIYKGQLGYANAILAASYKALETFDEALDTELASEKSEMKEAEQRALATFHPYASLVVDLYRRAVAFGPFKTENGSDVSFVGLRSLQGVTASPNEALDYFDDVFLWLCGKIAIFALRSNRTTATNNFVRTQTKASAKGTSNIWRLFGDNIPDNPQIDKQQQDLRYGGTHKWLANYLSFALAAGLRNEDSDLLASEPTYIAEIMIRAAVSAETEKCPDLGRLGMLGFIQLLINKFGADTTKLVALITQMIEEIPQVYNNMQAAHVFQTLSFVAAAGLAKLDKNTESLVGLMLANIKRPRFGRSIAESFRDLISPSEMLSKDNFCTIRPLRKGRLWSLTVNNMIKGLQEHKDEPKLRDHYLVALVNVLLWMDQKMLAENAAEVLPHLLRALDVPDVQTELPCLHLIHDMVLEGSCQKVIEIYTTSIISRMKVCSQKIPDPDSENAEECRAVATDVLKALAEKLTVAFVLRHRNRLLRDLDPVLSDPNREVRRRAGLCRMSWFNLVDA